MGSTVHSLTLVLLVGCVGCTSILGIDPNTHPFVPEPHTVTGTVTGMRAGAVVDLELTSEAVDEILPVAVDGRFAFTSEVSKGATYRLAIPGQPVPGINECTLPGESGVVGDFDIVVDVMCVRADLQTLGVSLPVRMTPAFDPSVLTYTAHVSTLVQATSVVPVAFDPTAAITIDAAAVDSASIALGDDTTLDIGGQVGTLHSSYSLEVTRGGLMSERAVLGAASPTLGYGRAVALDGDTLAIGSDNETVEIDRRVGANWVREAMLAAPNGHVGDFFGASVALWHDDLVVGAPNAEGIGAVYTFHRDSSGWDGGTRLVQGLIADGAHFGTSVAILGDNLVVGAPDEDKVLAYVRAGTGWTFTTQFQSETTDPGDRFGATLAYAADTLMIGAPDEASATGSPLDNSAPGAGAVYVWRVYQNSWQQYDFLKAPSPAAGEHFGAALAFDSTTIVVGAPDNNTRGVGAGQAYLFGPTLPFWGYKSTIASTTIRAGDHFGSAVAVAGSYVMVGAPDEQGTFGGINASPPFYTSPGAGAAYLFAVPAGTQTAYIKPSQPSANQAFATSVALSVDTAVAGAAGTAAAYVFH